MRNIISVAGLFIVTLVSASGCSLFAPSATSPEVRVGATDSNYTIWLKVNQILAVSLESNPSTGYTWEEVETPNPAILESMGAPTFVPSSNAIGAPGIETYKFRAVRTGETELKLVYRRPWETAEPIKTFELRVVVE